MAHVRFLPKVLIIYFREKAIFDCKHNYKRSKSANFWLDSISKINCKRLVVMLYTLLGLRLKKIKPVRRDFK